MGLSCCNISNECYTFLGGTYCSVMWNNLLHSGKNTDFFLYQNSPWKNQLVIIQDIPVFVHSFISQYSCFQILYDIMVLTAQSLLKHYKLLNSALNSKDFMEPNSSLPISKAGSCPKPAIHLVWHPIIYLGVLCDLILLDFPAKFCTNFSPVIAHLSPSLDLSQKKFVKSKNYEVPQYLVFSSLLLPSFGLKYFPWYPVLEFSVYSLPLMWRTKFHICSKPSRQNYNFHRVC